MSEKNYTISLLLDYYGTLLGDKQKESIDLYYNEDYSLSEIAENAGISRQGVRDQIKHAEMQLLEYEDKLELAKKHLILTDKLSELISFSKACNTEKVTELAESIKDLYQ